MSVRKSTKDAGSPLPAGAGLPLEQELWRDAQDAWRLFVDEGVVPAPSSWLSPDLIASWVRSRELGVDPYAEELAHPLTDDEYRAVVAAYRDLIEAARPLLGIIERLDLSDDYIFELVACNGVTVLRTGNLDLHSIILARSAMTEESMGTNAHDLSMRLRAPIQLIGPEHYCRALHGLAALAAPVFDRNGVVVASLLLTQPLPEEPWSEGYRKLLSDALSLITSICSMLERQMAAHSQLSELADASEKLELATEHALRTQNVLSMAVASSEEPMLVLDSAGVVRHASPEAVRLLRTTMDSVVSRPVQEVLGLPWPEAFQSIAEPQRMPIETSEGSHELEMRGYVVRNKATDDVDGSVLLLAEASTRRRKGRDKAGEEASITFGDILGKSSAMSQARMLARRYAVTAENVLIVGESGTGKEYFAQAIHNASRAAGPFMSVNCAAIPPRLIESELFGYESGAFTGADRAGKAGKIELADGGTLFLDEIGDMPLELQATLLRVLENKRVMRLGGKAYRQVDFRVVAATNRDLAAMVREGRFREDLLYRLSILTVTLPPLRVRNGDVMFFARYFLNECRCKSHGGPSRFSPEAEQLIGGFRWPGNVRQMKNAIYSAFYAATGDEIGASDLPSYLREAAPQGDGALAGAPSPEAVPAAAPAAAPAGVEAAPSPATAGADEPIRLPDELLPLRSVEKSAIRLAMTYAEGNVAKAAEMLQVSKATLYRKIKEYGLR